MKPRRNRPPLVGVVALATFLAVLGSAGLAATQAKKPPRAGADLKVVSVAGAPSSVKPAGRILLSTVIANVGTRPAGASDIRFVLAHGKKPVAKDLALVVEGSIASLRPRQRLRSDSLLAVVPPEAKEGAYWLFACVKVRPPGKERTVANNCLRVRQIQVAVGKPLAVTPVLAADRTASALVGPEGGSVEATAPNGAVVRLVVPEGALTGRTLISLVPLARLDGLSIAGVTTLGGVEIEPRGLLLDKPARLELTPPAGSAGPSLAFWYDPGGKDAHLVPFVSKPVFGALVSRFGGYVLASAADPASVARAMPLPADSAYRIEEAISEVLLGAGIPPPTRLKAHGDGDWWPEELRMLAIARYIDEIRPQLVALSHGVADPDAAAAVLANLQGQLLRQLELLGIDDPLDNWTPDASTLIQQVTKQIFETRLALCKQADVRNAVMLIGFAYRSGKGLDAAVGLPPYAKGLEELLGENWTSRAGVCVRLSFAVTFDTTNVWRDAGFGVGSTTGIDISWQDGSFVQAWLDGYSETQGESMTAEIQAWQQGTPLRWKGTGPNRITQVTKLAGFPEIYYLHPGGGQATVEIVPVVETFDPKLQRVDTTGRLLIRFFSVGHVEEWCTTCGAEGQAIWLTDVPGISWINFERGDEGKFNQRRGVPTSIGDEHWYEMPVQGGVLEFADAGGITYAPRHGWTPPGPGTWSVTGPITVTPEPPRARG